MSRHVALHGSLYLSSNLRHIAEAWLQSRGWDILISISVVCDDINGLRLADTSSRTTQACADLCARVGQAATSLASYHASCSQIALVFFFLGSFDMRAPVTPEDYYEHLDSTKKRSCMSNKRLRSLEVQSMRSRLMR